MYSEKKNILQLTSLLKSYGIKDIVACPGSRNAPLIHTFVKAGFNCYTVVDERSAGFFALGIILKKREPVAVCCTSGTALSNLSSAVAEAFYQELPLLVISADRPAAWIGQMDGQTLPQPGIFGSLVKSSVQLPEPATPDQEWYCNRLINEALLKLTHHGKGPVHINIPLSEPLFSFEAEEIPVTRKITTGITARPVLTEEVRNIWKKAGKVLIVAGQQLPGHGLQDILLQLTRQKGCVILGESLANLPSIPAFFTLFDTLLYADEEWEKYRPDLLITLGGHIVSKRLKAFLRRFPAEYHFHINPTGEVVDTYQQVTHILEGETGEIVSGFINEKEEESVDTSYLQKWTGGIQKIRERLSAYTPSAFSGLQVVKEVIHSFPVNVPVHIANSSAIRLFQLFEPGNDLHCYCNRGTSGIDGTLSTAMGFAAVHQGLTFLITGDLSFFYDMNALGINYPVPGLRILLLNNGGGGIFHLLPGLNRSEIMPQYVAASHRLSAKAWAGSAGFHYLKASTEEEFRKGITSFTSRETEAPVLFEIKTDTETDSRVFKEYYHHIKS